MLDITSWLIGLQMLTVANVSHHVVMRIKQTHAFMPFDGVFIRQQAISLPILESLDPMLTSFHEEMKCAIAIWSLLLCLRKRFICSR